MEEIELAFAPIDADDRYFYNFFPAPSHMIQQCLGVKGMAVNVP